MTVAVETGTSAAAAFEGFTLKQRCSIGAAVDEVSHLCDETAANTALPFKYPPASDFRSLLKNLAKNARMFLYRAEGRVAAFNSVMQTHGHSIDKYIGAPYDLALKYSLYLKTGLRDVRDCIERSIPVYRGRQAFHRPRLRPGCRLQTDRQYFRHGNVAINAALQRVARIVRPGRFDPALADLVKGSS